MSKKLLYILALCFFATTGFAGSYEKGIEAFVYNKPLEASTQLEKAINEDPSLATAYLYLAISYEQLGKYDKSNLILQQAYERGFGNSWVLLYNMGIIMTRSGDNKGAISYYDRAIQEKSDYTVAFFNRADTYVRLKNYGSAKADYLRFLELGPSHVMAPEARKMLAAIDEEAARAEAARIAEEKRKKDLEDQAKAAAERAAQEAERKRLEEEKRKKLLEDVFNSLDNAQDDTVIVGPGSEDVGQNEDQFGREQ